MNITYLHHSGFLVETHDTALLFDYYTENGKYHQVHPEDFAHRKFFVLVSHGHGDHFDQIVLKWADRAHYILAEGVPLPAGFQGDVTWMKPHETVTIDGVEIRTLQSNDEGVAFLVKTGHTAVFHSGDLNWWHWNGESDAFNAEIADSFRREIDLLKGEEIEVAFVPADPRLEDKYDWAVDYYMQTIGAKVLFPMHFWRQFAVCEQLRQKPYGAHVAWIRKEGEAFTV